MRSEHMQLQELARAIVATDFDPEFSGLIDQLRWMIHDHIELERSLLRTIAPPGRDVDEWAELADLERVADLLVTERRAKADVLLDSIVHHCDLVEMVIASACAA